MSFEGGTLPTNHHALFPPVDSCSSKVLHSILILNTMPPCSNGFVPSGRRKKEDKQLVQPAFPHHITSILHFAMSISYSVRVLPLQAYTFGLCGPLKLAPRDAVITDSTYNGGFMTGRIISVLLGGFVKPRNMIFASSGCCISASILLIALGTSSKFGLYIGTGKEQWEMNPQSSFSNQRKLNLQRDKPSY